jgi:GWxTD domain-containing protein
VVKERMLNQDIAYIYDPTQTIIKKKINYGKDSIRIYLSFADPHDHLNSKDFINRYAFFYKIREDYVSSETIKTDSIKFTNKDIVTENNIHYLTYAVKSLSLLNTLLIVERFDKKRKILDLIDIPLRKDSSFIKNICMFFKYNTGIPVLDNFVSKNDSFTLYRTDSREKPLRLLHYNLTLPPAIPPYDETNGNNLKQIDPDFSTEIIPGQRISFNKSGLYTLNTPDDLKGFSFIVTEHKFPKLSRPEEMIEPLYYLTSQKEYKNLKNSPHPKFTADSFWLAIGGSQDYSKKLIKSYYQKVEFANRSFTSYKEGWKTDRGMIYIVFGKPDEVYRYNNMEEWTYENISNNSITFNFLKKNNLFSSDEDYELLRKESYEFYWTEIIEKWRKGNIIK